MANFAKIGLDNRVIDIQFIDTINTMTPEGVEDEAVGRAYLAKIFGHETWVQTSFNTSGGKHYDAVTGGLSVDQTKALRKNYAGIGYTYDSARDAFIAPKPFDTWVLNEDTCLWVPPIPRPADGKMYQWDEATTSWVEVTE
jgi:hypothetical protein